MNTNTTTATQVETETRITALEKELQALRCTQQEAELLDRLRILNIQNPEALELIEKIRPVIRLAENIRTLKERYEDTPGGHRQFWTGVQFAFLRHDLAGK